MRVGLFFLAAAASITVSAAPPSTSATVDPSLLSPLHWRSIGPAATGGRIDDFAVARVPGAPDAIYVATAAGGVFKSTNQGTSWSPIFDRVDAMMSVGDVAVAPSNPGVVWVGTGEANNRQSSSWGDGVYKSTDAGRTWTAAGLKDTRHIGRIVIHPTNPDIVYVAAAGHLWGPNAERGVFRTADGGRTWRKSLFVDENTGATDIVMDPQNPDVLFAATYQRQRAAWGFNGGGPGSGIYRTEDAGVTWTKLAAGLPRGDKGRIGLDIFRGDGRIVYATVEAAGRENGVYRSTNRGESWELLASLNPRPMYFSQIRVDPKDRDRVYILGSNRGFYVSDDGGKNFRDVFSTVHSEDHALWIDPDDTNHLIVGGDGGVSISWDRGATWLFRDNLPVSQFYEISVDMQQPYTICGGLQDNGHWCVPSATRLRTGISNRDAFNIGGGDGFYARIDPSDAHTVVVESQEGRANRVDLVTLERQAIQPIGEARPKARAQSSPERQASAERLRWNWNTPIAMSAADPKVLYIGAQMLFRSADRGVTWKAISPDLTANVDRSALQMMGGAVSDGALSRHDGQTFYSTLTTISESPLDAKVLYTGSDDGRVHVTRDGGRTWADVTTRLTAPGAGVPPGTYVSSVLASRHSAGRVYVTFDGHYTDEDAPWIFASEDFGETWRALGGGLPFTSVHKLREHPRNPRLLFVGHERGIHFSIDGGGHWAPLTLNMPPVPVDDLLIHPRDNDLVVATHGRGIWVLDNIASLEALTPESMATEAFLAPPARAQLLTIYSPQAWYGAGQFFAPNPDAGAAIDYYLRDPVPGNRPVTVIVSDASGAVIRTLTGPGLRGINRVRWDLRMEPPPTAGDGAPAGGPGGEPIGPSVLAGTYTVAVQLTGGRSLKSSLVVEDDPRMHRTDADRRARQAALMKLYELQKTVARVRGMARSVSSAAAGRGSANPAAARLDQLQAVLTGEMTQATVLSRTIDAYSGAPTVDQRRQLDALADEVGRTIAELNRLLQPDSGNQRPH